MTYIVGGKLNGNPFLMIDCKAENDESFYLYYDKVEKFSSAKDETYYCQMGHTDIKGFILLYDDLLKFSDESIDVFNKRDILRMFEEINKSIEYSDYKTPDYKYNCLFFISKDNVCKYNINFDLKNRKYMNINQVEIDDNKCLTSNSIACRDVISDDIEEFCKWIIEEEKMGIKDDLKDRYTFIFSTGDKLVYKKPHKSINDIINSHMRLGFDKLE